MPGKDSSCDQDNPIHPNAAPWQSGCTHKPARHGGAFGRPRMILFVTDALALGVGLFRRLVFGGGRFRRLSFYFSLTLRRSPALRSTRASWWFWPRLKSLRVLAKRWPQSAGTPASDSFAMSLAFRVTPPARGRSACWLPAQDRPQGRRRSDALDNLPIKDCEASSAQEPLHLFGVNPFPETES